MKALTAFWVAMALTTSACGDNIDDDDDPVCGLSATVTGDIVDGRQVVPGVTLPVPLKVSVNVYADVPIERVVVGTAADPTKHVVASLTAQAPQHWDALIYPSDLEKHRDAETSSATMEINAIDTCGVAHPIGSVLVALGPAPGITIQDLAVTAEDVGTDCFIPSDGRITPTLHVTASLSSLGSKVTLTATHGTLPNGMASQELTLVKQNEQSTYAISYFAPTSAGTALIEATGSGIPAKTSILVAGPPTVDISNATPLRNNAAFVDFVSEGNLKECVIDQSSSGAAVVAELAPSTASSVNGVVNVSQTPDECTGPEYARFKVTFDSSAPNGAQVIIRCTETTYGRSATAKLTVMTP